MKKIKRMTECARALFLARKMYPHKSVPSPNQKKGEPTKLSPILRKLTAKQGFAIFKQMEKEGYVFKVHISVDKNQKLEEIPCANLPAKVACAPWVTTACAASGCYALKGNFLFDRVGFASWKNFYLAVHHTDQFFRQIGVWIDFHRPRFFRWHSAGDIQNQRYYDNMVVIAEANMGTKFLVFTKKYKLDYSIRPKTLAVVLSAWPGHPVYNPLDLPVAYMQDGTEDRMTEADLECPGSCMTCAACWNLPKLKINAVFPKH